MRTQPVDGFGRRVRDLRLSVTDRCNFRCTYCMPRAEFGHDHAFSSQQDLLSFEELARVVRIFVGLGVSKVRLTGGEPLLRRDLESLVAMIAATPGVDDIAMTTNGSLLADRATSLRAAGLQRVTVSLDSVDPEVFAAMADTPIPLAAVVDGVAAAVDAGLAPVKLNAVVRRGVNDVGLMDLVDYARANRLTLRVIEYMDVGTSNRWDGHDVVPAAEICAQVAARYPMEPVPSANPSDVARRWRYLDGGGEFGVIASVTEPFCTDCVRARLTATGQLFTCLFATAGSDLRALLRTGATDEDIATTIAEVWQGRRDRYSVLRRPDATAAPKPEMSYLGG
jgi:cyclic pyranopterin phosphate synthase